MVKKSDWDPFYVPIKREGGVANPDEYTFDCDCPECQAKYDKWKEEYLKDQKLEGKQP